MREVIFHFVFFHSVLLKADDGNKRGFAASSWKLTSLLTPSLLLLIGDVINLLLILSLGPEHRVSRCSIGRFALLLYDLNIATTYYIIVIFTTASFDVDTGILVQVSLIRHSEITITCAVDCVSFHAEVLRLDWLHAA